MVPLPPPDPELRSLAVAFDGDAMAEQLDVDRCRPRYARYRPGRGCVVLYELDHGSGHLTMLTPRRADRLWSRVRAVDPGLRAFRVPELGAVMQLHPFDVRLPGLVAALSEPVMGRELGAACSVELVRYKPGRRAVLRYGIDGRVVYGKLRADTAGAAHVDLARELIAQGVETPAPLGYLPRLRMTLHSKAPGTRLAELRGSPRATPTGWSPSPTRWPGSTQRPSPGWGPTRRRARPQT